MVVFLCATAVVTCGGSCGERNNGCLPSSGTISGTFSDGDGDYQANEDCWWLISTTPGNIISVRFYSFAVSYDTVRIYACKESTCASTSSTQVGGDIHGTSTPTSTYTSSTGFLKIAFTSGRAWHSDSYAGFTGTWSVGGGASLCHDSALFRNQNDSQFLHLAVSARGRYRNCSVSGKGDVLECRCA